MDLSGRNALVTGGAHRVGKAIALALAERGCDLVVHFHQSVEAATQTEAEIRKLGVQATAIQADLSSMDGIERLFQKIDDQAIPLDILINSAAVMERVDLLLATEDDWQRTINLNLKGAFFCLQQAALRMQQNGGAIVNISDVAGTRPWARYPVHSISKAGIEMLTQVCALALAPKIRVNAVMPGPVIKPEWLDEDRWQQLTEKLPLKRAGSGLDVAEAVVFLVENEYITGETLTVDGGDHLE
jgi:NAD(P)-dependent dehydrogenase (short-subunit alcohol dehydrogenase family)